MPALLHVTLYSFCLGVALLHLIFAAWSAEKGRQDWSEMIKGGTRYSLVLIEDGPAYHKAYRFAIFRAVVASLSAVYFCAHLVVRRIWPKTWFIWCSTDFGIILAISALTVAAQLNGMYFASAPAVLDIISFFLLAVFYLVLVVSILLVFLRGVRLEGFKRALCSSVDRLKHVRRYGAPDPPVRPIAAVHNAPIMPEIRISHV